MKEIWKTIYDNYEISNTGRLKSNFTNKLLRFEVSKKGYFITKIIVDGKRKRIGVHRLVALAFIPNPNNYPQINHKDENPQNNNVENLEWCTAKYNMNYGSLPAKISKMKKGTKNPFFGKKHTEETKAKMRKKHYISKEAHQKMSNDASKRLSNQKWINNGIINKRVMVAELNNYLQNGWILHRLPNSKTSMSLKKYYENNPEKKYWGANKNKGIKFGGKK